MTRNVLHPHHPSHPNSRGDRRTVAVPITPADQDVARARIAILRRCLGDLDTVQQGLNQNTTRCRSCGLQHWDNWADKIIGERVQHPVRGITSLIEFIELTFKLDQSIAADVPLSQGGKPSVSSDYSKEQPL